MAAGREAVIRIARLHESFINRSYWKIMVFGTKIEAVRWIREKAKDKFGIDGLTLSESKRLVRPPKSGNYRYFTESASVN
jgi:hypothetical protein